MTIDEARNLPPAIDVPTYAALLGISRNAAYRDVAAGNVDAVRVGKSIRIITATALRRLGLEPA